MTNGAAGGQAEAARALGLLAWGNADNQIAVAEAIGPLVALLRNGAADGQEQAALALWMLNRNDANNFAIVVAGGVEALVALVRNDDRRVKYAASCALEVLELAPIASRVRILQAENESLKRQLDRIDVAQ